MPGYLRVKMPRNSFIGTHYSSWTNRLINAKDHASVQVRRVCGLRLRTPRHFTLLSLSLQIKVANIDATTGKYEGDYQVYALCGFIRGKVSFRVCQRAWCCRHSRKHNFTSLN